MKFEQLIVAASVALAFGAHAQPAPAPVDHAGHHGAAGSPAPTLTPAPLVDGEVRKVDLSAGKLTLRHGPIPNLDMPGMTMVFNVSTSGLLSGLKVGDKVRFTADRQNGVLTVTGISGAK